MREADMAARSLLILGGLNWLSVAAGNVDFVGQAARAFVAPRLVARVMHGIIGGAALWSLSRMIEQEAFPKAPRRSAAM